MPIAQYTQEIIDSLRDGGKATVRFGGGMNMTSSKARSRLTDAASRAGLRVTTRLVWLDSLYGYGRIEARVIDTETTSVIE